MSLFRRELAAFFHAPIAYAVGALFLAVQGALFWAVAVVLSDPTRPAPFGAVLAGYFGGQVLYWVISFVLVAVASMGAIAEERRAGTWETLLTAPVSDTRVVVSKWAAALCFVNLLWLPTLLYPLIIAWFSTSAGAFDPGPLITVYAVLFAQNAAFVALGIAASSATRSQIVAAAATVLPLALLLLLGQLPEVMGTRSSLLSTLDIRAHLADGASGALGTEVIGFYAGVTVVALFAAHALVARDRTVRAVRRQRGLAVVLVTITAVAVEILLVRHPCTLDASRQSLNSLDDATVEVLRRVSEPVEVLLVRPTFQRFDPIYDQLDELLERMARLQPQLQVTRVDPALAARLAEEQAARVGLRPEELAEGGMLILSTGGQTAVIELLDLAEFDRDDLGVGRVARFAAEDAIASALARFRARDRAQVCFTSANRELVAGASGESVFDDLRASLAREGIDARRIDLGDAVPQPCTVLAILAPALPLTEVAGEAVLSFATRGGRLMVIASPGSGGPGLGVDTALAELGVGVGRGVVVDPAARDGSGRWVTASGYHATHPITRRFLDRRVTVWSEPRQVLGTSTPAIETTELVFPSEAGHLVGGDAADERPAVAIAAENRETGARAVLWGGATAFDLTPPSANGPLLVESLVWLAGRESSTLAAAKTPRTVRLILRDGDRALVFGLCVVGLPLAFLVGGSLLWWRRRRA